MFFSFFLPICLFFSLIITQLILLTLPHHVAITISHAPPHHAISPQPTSTPLRGDRSFLPLSLRGRWSFLCQRYHPHHTVRPVLRSCHLPPSASIPSLYYHRFRIVSFFAPPGFYLLSFPSIADVFAPLACYYAGLPIVLETYARAPLSHSKRDKKLGAGRSIIMQHSGEQSGWHGPGSRILCVYSVSVATTAARFNIGNLPDPLLKRAAAGCLLATYIATEGEGKKKSERERERLSLGVIGAEAAETQHTYRDQNWWLSL